MATVHFVQDRQPTLSQLCTYVSVRTSIPPFSIQIAHCTVQHNTCLQACTHKTQTHADTHRQAHACKHAHALTYVHTHPPTHTHTHTQTHPHPHTHLHGSCNATSQNKRLSIGRQPVVISVLTSSSNLRREGIGRSRKKTRVQ